jgi:hypothetical protein
MNIVNLKRAFNYMLTVKPEEFNMGQYLSDTKDGPDLGLPLEHPCSTIGCIIGKCAENFYTPNDRALGYSEWAEGFFDLSCTDYVYGFLFSAEWADSVKTATLEQALLRMKFVIGHGGEPAEYHYFGFARVMTVQPLTPYEICT